MLSPAQPAEQGVPVPYPSPNPYLRGLRRLLNPLLW